MLAPDPHNILALTQLPASPVDGGGTVMSAEIRLPLAFEPTAYLRHGWHSFSATGWSDAAAPPQPIAIPALRMVDDDPAFATADWHNGAALGAVQDGEGQVLFIGALGLDARVHLLDGELVGRSTTGAEVEWFIASGDEHQVLAAYARHLGRRLGRRVAQPPRLWSSWYSYYEAIDEDALRATLHEVQSWPVDVFQIDDGWQQAVGDWHANDDFPSDMADLAVRIKDAGKRPGLWLAPFIAWPSSRLFRDHPDWFVADDDGHPLPVGHNWRDWYYALDLTRDDVLDRIAETIQEVRSWGFDFLKLDFLFAGAVPGHRARSDIGREALYRTAVERIRAAAGDDAYLLACGAPIIPSIGVFDAIRISNDVSPYWDNPSLTQVVGATSEVGTRGAIATSLHRLWLQEVIATDPDVVFFRSHRNLMDPDERRWLQDLVILAGFRGTSDPPSWLTTDERDALVNYLAAEPVVHQRGTYRYEIDGRDVDFSAVAQRPPVIGTQTGPPP